MKLNFNNQAISGSVCVEISISVCVLTKIYYMTSSRCINGTAVICGFNKPVYPIKRVFASFNMYVSIILHPPTILVILYSKLRST